MYVELSSSFKLICNELKERTEHNTPRSDFDLTELLKTLNTNEKILVAKYFCKLPWNIGSLAVMRILHELRVLTATEFIISCENSEDVQLILNDFLEAEFELITNLYVNSTFDSVYSVRLNDVLEKCLENLFKDLIAKPELNGLNHLKYMQEHLPDEILLKIIHKHLAQALKLHQSSVNDVFRLFSTWINEGVNDLRFPKDLYEKLLSSHIEDSINFIMKQSSMENFREWKFYLILLQAICSGNNEKAGPFVRKYLKLRLKQCATVPCKRSMMHLLFTARASNAVTMDVAKNLDLYADWYKNNIGEMKIFLKADEFQNVLNLLEQCIVYEMEIDYLEIHAAISISPPVLCGKLVQSYKIKCKQRLQQIRKGSMEVENINESIVIEDSN